MMEGYFGSRRTIRLVVQLIDMRHPPSADDLAMLDYLAQMQYPFVIALTKCDKLNKAERAARTQALAQELAAYPENFKNPVLCCDWRGRRRASGGDCRSC